MKRKLMARLKTNIPPEAWEKLPSGYAIIGDIAIVRFRKGIPQNYMKIIGDTLITSNPQINLVYQQTDTRNEFRKPIVKHIAGKQRTTTVHKEYNTTFHIDISKLTFSPGNKNERRYLCEIAKQNEIVVDMFACIGNLSLPMTVNNKTIRTYAIEKNPTAFEFLRKNIKENDVGQRYFPILGDNREKTPEDIASRVIMGYFGIDQEQYLKAIKAIKEEGWIHAHQLIQRNEMKDMEKKIESVKKFVDFKIKTLEIRKIKKFSPSKIHYCMDIFVEKQ